MIGLFAGTAAAGEWRTYLLWANRTDFGRTDPFFRKDIGFYVFELPWLHYLVNFADGRAVISLLAAATVHYLYGGIRLQTPRRPADRRRPGAVLGAARPLRAGQGRRLLARPLRPGQRVRQA